MYAYEGPFSREEVQAWLDKQLRRYREDGFGLWALVEKSSGALIGQCGLTLQDYKDRRVPEIGYLLRRAYWHRGFAIEAARGLQGVCVSDAWLPGGLLHHTRHQPPFAATGPA